jgi:predicted NAD/FAD-binding protein
MQFLRDFASVLQLLLRAAAVLFVALCDFALPCVRARKRAPPRTVAIVGSGIAGSAAAFALRASGFEVEVFEASAVVGGNAKQHTWAVDGVTTGLSVVAWPRAYFRNYRALLSALRVPTARVALPFYVARADGEAFAHGRPGEGLSARYAAELAGWARMVAAVRAASAALADGGPQPTLYAASPLNPFNVVPLRFLSRLFGCGGAAFWADVVVPVYASSFLSTELDGVPAVVLPVLWDMIPLDAARTVEMESWASKGGSAEVFAGLLRGARVRTGAPVERVELAGGASGGWLVHAAGGGGAARFDAVVFACGAQAAARALAGAPLDVQPTRALLRGVEYCRGPAFERGVVHSRAALLPAPLRGALLGGFANYIVAHGDRGGPRRYENTFILSSWAPSAAGSRVPRLVTYDAREPGALRAHEQAHVANVENHPVLSFCGLAASQLLRAAQGRRNLYFCGSYATPGNGHDLSLLSGLVVAAALGAAYPFPNDAGAAADFARMRRLMGL